MVVAKAMPKTAKIAAISLVPRSSSPAMSGATTAVAALPSAVRPNSRPRTMGMNRAEVMVVLVEVSERVGSAAVRGPVRR